MHEITQPILNRTLTSELSQGNSISGQDSRVCALSNEGVSSLFD